MAVKAGYKQTEVGVIPEDWEVAPIGKLVSEFRGGAPLKPSDFTKSGVKVLPKGGIGRTGWLNIEETDLQFCSFEYASSHKNNCVDETFTIVVLRDLVPSGPSIGLMVRIKNKEHYVLAQGCYGFKVNEAVDPGYLVQLSNTHWYRKLANSIMVGSTQVHITNTALKLAKIPVPPFKEQTAIATALSDTDALIEALEQLIHKKRQIKQGAMQELLTGKKRLPGFSGEWEVRRLGDSCELITKGTTPTSIGRDFSNAGVNFIKVESLESDGKIIKDKVAFIDIETHRLLSRSQIKEGDLLISIAGALGRVAIVDQEILPANTNQALSIARFKKDSDLDVRYVFHFLGLDKIKKHIDAISVQGAQANLSLKNIADLPIDAPDVVEQTAISTILSDMDADIAALEEKLNKARAVKQGMMQELLTGRVRLV